MPLLIPIQNVVHLIENFEKMLHHGQTYDFEKTLETSLAYTEFIGERKPDIRDARVATALLQYRLLDVLIFLHDSLQLLDVPTITTCPVPFSKNPVRFPS